MLYKVLVTGALQTVLLGMRMYRVAFGVAEAAIDACYTVCIFFLLNSQHLVRILLLFRDKCLLKYVIRSLTI